MQDADVQRTLLELLDAAKSPGCKRKRSITHISGITVASILPRAPNPILTTPHPACFSPSGLGEKGGPGVNALGRAVVVRKKVGLVRLFASLGVGAESGCADQEMESVSVYARRMSDAVEGTTDRQDEDDSDEDDDLIVIV